MLVEDIDRETWEKNFHEGFQKGVARILLRLLHLKFGPLSAEVEERVSSTDADRLLEWSDRVLTAERLQDVFGD